VQNKLGGGKKKKNLVQLNVKVQWNNIKKCVLDTMSDLKGKVDRKARKPWILYEMIKEINKQRKWKNISNEERKNNLRRLRNKMT